MSSPTRPPALLPAGRMRWVWLVIAAALGVWLLSMLLLSGPEAGTKNAAPASGTTRNATFDSPAADVFSNRHPVKSSRPLPSFPVRSNEGKSE